MQGCAVLLWMNVECRLCDLSVCCRNSTAATRIGPESGAKITLALLALSLNIANLAPNVLGIYP